MPAPVRFQHLRFTENHKIIVFSKAIEHIFQKPMAYRRYAVGCGVHPKGAVFPREIVDKGRGGRTLFDISSVDLL